MFGPGKKSKSINITAEDWATFPQALAKYDSPEIREFFLQRHKGIPPQQQYRTRLLFNLNVYRGIPHGVSQKPVRS